MPAESRYLGRFQLDGNGADISNQAQVRAGDSPGDALNVHGHELSTEWEQSVTGVTVQVAGLTDLVIQGPNGPDILTPDTTESYLWVPGADYTNGAVTYTFDSNGQPAGLAAWVVDFKAAYAADNTLRATLVLDDGVAAAADVAATFTAGTPTFTVSVVAEPLTTRDAAVAFTAGTPTFTATLEAQDVGDRDIGIEYSAGTPTFVVTADSNDPVPGVPTDVRADNATQDSIAVEWTAPADLGVPALNDYEVRIGSGQWQSTGTTATRYLLTGLEPGTNYEVQVRAVNTFGSSAASAAATLATLPAVVPTVPRRLRSSVTGQRSIELDWTAPDFDGGSPITGYEVCVATDFADPEPFRPTGLATRTIVRGLAFGHRYSFPSASRQRHRQQPADPRSARHPHRSDHRAGPDKQRAGAADRHRPPIADRPVERHRLSSAGLVATERLSVVRDRQSTGEHRPGARPTACREQRSARPCRHNVERQHRLSGVGGWLHAGRAHAVRRGLFKATVCCSRLPSSSRAHSQAEQSEDHPQPDSPPGTHGTDDRRAARRLCRSPSGPSSSRADGPTRPSAGCFRTGPTA